MVPEFAVKDLLLGRIVDIDIIIIIIIVSIQGCSNGKPKETVSLSPPKPKLINTINLLKYLLNHLIEVFCPRAGSSLQTQAPRLQLYPKAGLPLQSQESRL